MRKILLILTPLLFFYCSKEDETSKSNLEESKTENIDKKSNFSLQVFSSNGGGVSSEGGVFKEGTKVKLTAFPDTNYVFSHWSNGVEESETSLTITSNTSITAFFIDENIIEDGFYLRIGLIKDNGEHYYDDAYPIVFKYQLNKAVFTGKTYTNLSSFPIFKGVGYVPGENSDGLSNKMISKNVVHRVYDNNGKKSSWLLKRINENEIPNKKTHEEIMSLISQKGYWSDPIYAKIDPLNPKSYVLAFLEDAKRHGVDLSHVNPEKIVVSFREEGPAGASHLSCIDDDRIEFLT